MANPLTPEVAASILDADPDYRVLRRIRISEQHRFAENLTSEPCGLLAVIDTETTGLKLEQGARIIDLAVSVCEYGRHSGTLYRVVRRYESLEDPEQSISPEISRLTGITDDMVRGKRIDDTALGASLQGVSLIVCHNARFDRAFLEARYPAFVGMSFACTLEELPWQQWEIGSAKLDYLGAQFGLFHTAHRARADVDMVTALLTQTVPAGEGSLLRCLLASARVANCRVFATGLPFDAKDYASARGYRWSDGKDGAPKAWWIETRDEAAERAFLAAHGCSTPRIIKMTAIERYRPFSQIGLD